MIVCIAEKPSVARDIADVLGAKDKKDGYIEGNGYQVTWTFGHLCTLKEPHEYTPNWKSWSLGSLPMVPPRFGIKLISNPTYERQFHLPWRVQPDIAGGGYFYDLAPHQIDILQDMFGYILEANGYKSNRGGLYSAEDTLSACFQFDSGLVGSGSWCFVAHESAREDRIEIIGDKGMICFSVFTYDPIALHTERGREEIPVENPIYVQQPLIQAVVDHLLGKSICNCDGESATLTNWVMDKILNKI